MSGAAANRFRAPVSGFAVPTSGVPLWDPLGLQRRYCYSRSCMPEINRRRRVGAWLGQVGERVREGHSACSVQVSGLRSGNGVELCLCLPGHALGLPWMLAGRKASGAKPSGLGRRRREPFACPRGHSRGGGEPNLRSASVTASSHLRILSNPADRPVESRPAGPMEWTGFVSGYNSVARPSGGRMPPDAIASGTRNSG
ncbi:hypothetical protein BDD21_4566 [Thiocapsa rosea]|uniref:Uncharacterized protein n=1 Tax=Thiocapsa rosea TaxID=69360 RepID=A0A495VF38_9GAMM|nr:hypothetical protein BDD21_4566 [Thiocapsa rosea]